MKRIRTSEEISSGGQSKLPGSPGDGTELAVTAGTHCRADDSSAAPSLSGVRSPRVSTYTTEGQLRDLMHAYQCHTHGRSRRGFVSYLRGIRACNPPPRTVGPASVSRLRRHTNAQERQARHEEAHLTARSEPAASRGALLTDRRRSWPRRKGHPPEVARFYAAALRNFSLHQDRPRRPRQACTGVPRLSEGRGTHQK